MESAIKTLESKLKDLEMFAKPLGIITFAGEKIDGDEVIKEHKDAIRLIKAEIQHNELLEKFKKDFYEKSKIPDEVKQILSDFDGNPSSKFLEAIQNFTKEALK